MTRSRRAVVVAAVVALAATGLVTTGAGIPRAGAAARHCAGHTPNRPADYQARKGGGTGGPGPWTMTRRPWISSRPSAKSWMACG